MGKESKWHMSYRVRDAGLHALMAAPDAPLADALGTVARLAAGGPGITAEEALEACWLVQSYVSFIQRGLLHIEQGRRVLWLESHSGSRFSSTST